MVAEACATIVGCRRMVGQVTPVPTRNRLVVAAIAPSTPHTNGELPCASVHGWKWSEINAKGKPMASAICAAFTSSCGCRSSLDSV